MTATYGPWIAVNPGDAVPDGRGQVQMNDENRDSAELSQPRNLALTTWRGITAYRRLIEPVRGEVVKYWDGSHLSRDQCDGDTHRLILPTRDGELIPGEYPGPDGVIRVEVI